MVQRLSQTVQTVTTLQAVTLKKVVQAVYLLVLQVARRGAEERPRRGTSVGVKILTALTQLSAVVAPPLGLAIKLSPRRIWSAAAKSQLTGTLHFQQAAYGVIQ